MISEKIALNATGKQADLVEALSTDLGSPYARIDTGAAV